MIKFRGYKDKGMYGMLRCVRLGCAMNLSN